MDVPRIPTFRSLDDRGRRIRAATLLLGLCVVAAGGGFTWAKAGWSDDRDMVVPLPGVSETAPAPQAAAVGPVPSEILTAFRAGRRDMVGKPAYEPTELPSDCRLVVRAGRSSSDDVPGDDAPSVLLTVGNGYLAFYDHMTNDLANLPGSRCGSVDGHPATVYHVLGGDLVQWNSGGSEHGVFGYGVPRTLLLRVVAGMRKVEEDPRKALSLTRELLNSRSRVAGVVLESVFD